MSSGTGREYPNTTSQNLKRKSGEVDDDKGLDIDLKDEMVGTGKAGPSERGRAARSERRLRRKNNERLRKIQKLIPNCNKVDEVSILDEAIDYVKRLQHEVQMSTAAGFYMPVMKLPPPMQRIQAAYVPCFSPIGMGFPIDSVARVPVVQGTYPNPSAMDVSMEVPNSRPPTNANNMMEQEVVTSD